MPKVSVVIPLYNAAPYLDDLKQVWDQTFTDFELILVDDCSSDDTWERLERFKATYPELAISLVRNEHNLGPGGSRNHGLELCSGQYVIFIDGDDRYEPEFLAKMVAKLEETKADVVYCGALMHDGAVTLTNVFSPLVVAQAEQFNAAGGAGAKEPDPFVLKTLLYQPSLYPVPWNKMVRREFLLQHGIVFPDFRLGEDKCWGIQILLHARKIALVSEPLYHHIARPTSLSVARSKQTLNDIFAMLEFELKVLEQAGLRPLLNQTWHLNCWDTIFSFMERIAADPELQQQLVQRSLAFGQAHQLNYDHKQLPLTARLGWYRLLPKQARYAQQRALLKEQYRLGRYLRRFKQLLARNT